MAPRQRSSGAGLALVAAVVLVGFLALRSLPTEPIPPGPSPSTSPSAVSIASDLATPAPTPTQTPEPTPTLEPVAALSDDGVFRLEIAAESPVVPAGDPINIATWLTYVGPRAVVEFGHADPAVGFSIRQLDGPEQMSGVGSDVCLITRQARGDRVAVPFVKGGQIRGIFDEAWFRDPQLHLPAGRWEVLASLEVDIPPCDGGGTTHRLHAGVTVTVTP